MRTHPMRLRLSSGQAGLSAMLGIKFMKAEFYLHPALIILLNFFLKYRLQRNIMSIWDSNSVM
jgi:hypothetical protein